MPFQIGNNYGRKSRAVEGTMRWLLDHADHRKKLQAACLSVLDQASNGNLAAFCILRDTLDGRPTQRIETADADARELDLAAIAQAVMLHRKSEAEEATLVPSERLPSPE